LSNKKLDWKTVLGLLIIVGACVAAYHITRAPEKNVSLPGIRVHVA